ncbi:zinc knuckle (CCHC-type) family protein [Actinidia rufa]|uniref:Zinc knuckle (CCHC-type) family protein n=1 Tax=Actinidia rufa TaxID=165716 RepID=A0A7J0GUE7_9ERIC|nr:zinc knuckle (CCHC-type) family protein [Actinidia rufa]
MGGGRATESTRRLQLPARGHVGASRSNAPPGGWRVWWWISTVFDDSDSSRRGEHGGAIKSRFDNFCIGPKTRTVRFDQNVSSGVRLELLDTEAGLAGGGIVADDGYLKLITLRICTKKCFKEIYKQATEEPSTALHGETVVTDISSHQTSMEDLTNEANPVPINISSISRENQISEEQKSRMEANRLKALERATSRGRSSQTA